MYVFEVVSSYSTVDIANEIHESGMVKWCEPNFFSGISATNTNYPEQYYLNNTGQLGATAGIDINAPEAWGLTTGCAIRVAVLDDGVEAHPELTGRLATGYDPLNPTNPGAPLHNGEGHGQACAGIIAAADNSLGIRGISSNSIIVPVKVLVNNYVIAYQDVAAAVLWAADPDLGNADILSNSWAGGSTQSTALTEAINTAMTEGRGGLGCVVVFAAGNGGAYLNYPANLPGVITVGAINKNGTIWDYSSVGSEVDLVAPSGQKGANAGDIRTIDRVGSNGYSAGDYSSTFGGTSAAAPQVAGVAALVLSANPSLTQTQVRLLLSQTATDMGAPGLDQTYGYGLVNAYKAVEKALGGPIVGPGIFCTTANYSLTGTPPGSVTWSGLGMMSVNSSAGTATATYVEDGYNFIRASISSGCGTILLTQPVYTGSPDRDFIVAESGGRGSGLNVLAPNNETEIYVTYSGPGTILENEMEIRDHSDWSVNYRNHRLFTLDYWHYPTPSNQYVYIRQRNSCGWGKFKETNWTFSTFFAKYTISPNPASDQVSLLFEELVDPKGLPEIVELLHESSTIPVRTLLVVKDDFAKIKNAGNKLSLDVRELAKGTYYLHVSYGGAKKPNMHRVLLK